MDTEKAKQVVQDRIAQLRKIAASEPDPWTRQLLKSAAADFERMLTSGDPILFSLPIAVEERRKPGRMLH